MALQIKRATRSESYLRLGLVGPSGSGKTYTALRVARGLVGDDGRILVVDTERGSASLYAGDPDIAGDFDVVELSDYAPDRYCEAIALGASEGYGAVVVDSLTHAWAGTGGALDMVDKAAIKSRSGNRFAAWRDVTPAHNRLVDAILGASTHLIVTMRAKTEWVLEEDSRGKKVPRKIGMAPIQRDGMEYEFTVVGDLDADHNLVVTKSRVASLADSVWQRPGADFAGVLRDWLSGAAPAPAPEPPTPKPAPQKPQHDKAKLYAECVDLAERSGDGEDSVRAYLKEQGYSNLKDVPVEVLQKLQQQLEHPEEVTNG